MDQSASDGRASSDEIFLPILRASDGVLCRFDGMMAEAKALTTELPVPATLRQTSISAINSEVTCLGEKGEKGFQGTIGVEFLPFMALTFGEGGNGVSPCYGRH